MDQTRGGCTVKKQWVRQFWEGTKLAIYTLQHNCPEVKVYKVRNVAKIKHRARYVK